MLYSDKFMVVNCFSTVEEPHYQHWKNKINECKYRINRYQNAKVLSSGEDIKTLIYNSLLCSESGICRKSDTCCDESGSSL